MDVTSGRWESSGAARELAVPPRGPDAVRIHVQGLDLGTAPEQPGELSRARGDDALSGRRAIQVIRGAPLLSHVPWHHRHCSGVGSSAGHSLVWKHKKAFSFGIHLLFVPFLGRFLSIEIIGHNPPRHLPALSLAGGKQKGEEGKITVMLMVTHLSVGIPTGLAGAGGILHPSVSSKLVCEPVGDVEE